MRGSPTMDFLRVTNCRPLSLSLLPSSLFDERAHSPLCQFPELRVVGRRQRGSPNKLDPALNPMAHLRGWKMEFLTRCSLQERI